MSGELSGDELVGALLGPVEPPFAGELVLVTSAPDVATPAERARAAARLAVLPAVVVGAPGVPLAAVADLVDLAAADEDELGAVRTSFDATPLAALGAAVLVRGSEGRPVGEGLVMESATFSALQAGPEHRAWLAVRDGTRARAPRADDTAPRVRVERTENVLAVTLARAEVRNALDVAMRDQLLEALAVAEADPDLRVELRGEGPSFCAGGDLDGFGTVPDVATGHVVRLRRSIGAVLDRLAPRATAFVHGHCAGSGVELAAFCDRVVARPDATFMLPELSLGLVPGAGGTVSLPRRIGRHRTAWLVLTGRSIDAATAHAWNLVDEIRLF